MVAQGPFTRRASRGSLRARALAHTHRNLGPSGSETLARALLERSKPPRRRFRPIMKARGVREDVSCIKVLYAFFFAIAMCFSTQVFEMFPNRKRDMLDLSATQIRGLCVCVCVCVCVRVSVCAYV